MAILIKRYANRKLYDTRASRYITLKGIAELLEAGEEVRVIDNETGEDITSVTLSQILVDTERANRSVPGRVLSELLGRGGDALYTALKRGVGDASEGLEELQRNVRRILGREGARRGDWIAFASPDLDRILQGAFERVMRVLDLPRRSDVEALSKKLDRLTEALGELEAREGRGARRTAPRPAARREGDGESGSAAGARAPRAEEPEPAAAATHPTTERPIS